MLRLRTPAVLAASMLGHGALLVGLLLPATPEAAPRAQVALKAGAVALRASEAAALRERVREGRRRLVGEARAALRQGTLSLGEFLLQANAIDAEESGKPIDLEAARGLYVERLSALREALRASSLAEAVPEVFTDLRYFGRPGGLMADALFDRGGSCEQLSHLIAATAYDAGRRSEIALRFYGGVTAGGASHLTPVAGSGAAERDLLTGHPSLRKGTRFEAAELVESYARSHGLAPPLAPALAQAGGTADGPAPREDAGRSSMTAGYPPNGDRYPGSLPLYAARAVELSGDEESGEAEDPAGDAAVHARYCAFFVRMAVLDPPMAEVEPGEGTPSRAAGAAGSQVELRRVPTPSELTRMAGLLRAAEDLAGDRTSDPSDRLMSLACLAALGDETAVDLSLAGEPALAAVAREKAKEAAASGARAIADVDWKGEEGAHLRARLAERFAGQTWLLLVLPGGDRVVLDLVGGASQEDWGQVNALAGLVVARPTRERAVALLGGLSKREQVDVMHEIFHAQDHLRPWASNYAIDDGPGRGRGPFRLAYGVFRGLAWRLWEGQRPVPETLAALHAEVLAAGLDAEWEAVLLDYYGRNVLGLWSHRADGLEVVAALKEAIGASREPALELLRRRLDDIEAHGKLDAASLSEAWRLR
jgi:hypothetical protein